MLGTRMEKLEKDLQLLSVMQNLLVNGSRSNGHEDGIGVAGVVRKLFERPERDAGHCVRKNITLSQKPDKIRLRAGSLQSISDLPEIEEHSHTSPDYDIAALNQELKSERERRNDVEEAARRVAIKLQQTEDEIEREKESKKALLVGTLHLKNQLQGYEGRINQLEIEIGVEKTGKLKLLQDLEILKNEKTELKRRIDNYKNDLERERTLMLSENNLIKSELKGTQEKLEQCNHKSAEKEHEISQNDQKFRSQINQFVTKCAQIDKERERLELELRKTITNAQLTELELLQVREKLTKLETQYQRSTVVHESVLNKTKSEMSQQKIQVDEQIRSAHALLGRTKGLIVQLREERDIAQTALLNSDELNKKYKVELESLRAKAKSFERNKHEATEKLHALMTEKQEKDFHFEKEIRLLKEELKKVKAEKAKTLRFLNQAKSKFLKEQNRMEETLKCSEEERNKLTADLARQKENFQIIQKISQDQIATIQKLKTDLSSLSDSKHKLESTLRETENSEASVSKRLDEEIRENKILENHVEYLEAKLKGMEEDLKSHSCEDFVESSYKNKVVKIETALKGRYADWQRSIENLKTERNEAIAAARKAKLLAEEAKTECETRVSDSRSLCRQEVAKIQAENQRILSDRSTKIYELEGQLERMRVESSQTQRSLMGKIQQLQLALNICLGGVSSNPIPATATGFGVNMMS